MDENKELLTDLTGDINPEDLIEEATEVKNVFKPFQLADGEELNVDPEGKLPESVREAVKQKLMSGELSSDEVAMKERIKNMSNKQKFRLGIRSEGYKAGFTRPTIEKKRADNRKKNKVARASRKANR